MSRDLQGPHPHRPSGPFRRPRHRHPQPYRPAGEGALL